MNSARSFAEDAVSRMTHAPARWDWVHYFDRFDPESPACMPVSAFVVWLRDEWPQVRHSAAASTRDTDTVSASPGRTAFDGESVADFFERTADVVVRAPMFHGPDNWQNPYSIRDKPAVPPPKAMIEFVPGAPWPEFEDSGEDEWVSRAYPAFLRWREDIRPVAEALERSLGEPVYYFADLDDELDDDNVHRFLVLHWCCSWQPESSFVEYLLEVSGARDVDELKSALIDPASYRHPFEMNDAFFGIDPIDCRFEYPSNERITVGFVFSTREAREAAYYLVQQTIGAHALLVAPPELLDRAWIEQATVNCCGWSARYMTNQAAEAPISVLAQVDRLHVIADRQDRSSRAFDLQLSDSVEDLLWLAIKHGVDARYCTPDRVGLGNPEMSLERRSVPEREAARQARRSEYTAQLKEIRIYCDFGSSGLWDERGRTLSYDDLDLPFVLIRRIAAWQQDFDETEMPPSRSDDAWRQRHEQERLAIAQALRTELEGRVTVVA